MQWILYGFIFLIVFLAYFVVNKARQKPNFGILEIGNFITLTLTLIILAIYAFDTNKLARLTQKRWERESILLATYSMAVVDHKGDKGRTGFLILNPSNLMLQAKVWCNFQVYGEPVDSDDAFNGKKVWTILPSQPYNGWFEIESFLKQKGKTVEEMIKKYSDENREKQLTMDLKIEFRNELGDSRILPSMKYYFVFKEWKWIPNFTDKKDWSF
jgi:heme/copper-type cytochrome/quinol oxidase subunit 2